MMEIVRILPAEHMGQAQVIDGFIDVGGVKVPWVCRADVYVRRRSTDLRVEEILLAQHDGLAQEELDQENEEAERYPLGPKEYWRSKMVGKYLVSVDGGLMTDADFEAEWEEQW